MEIHRPEDVGLSSERLARISAVFETAVENGRLPGIMTLLQRRGKVVQFGKYGLMDIEAGKPMQEDALFRIYSMTKPIVSVALMTLLEEGRLGLDDPLSRYVPAFAKTKVWAGSAFLKPVLVDQDPEITLHHLITHTAGLSYGWFFDTPVEDRYREIVPTLFQRDKTLQEAIEEIAELPLVFQPGTQWRYSYATDVLGYVVQVIADMPLADFLEERIFRPLGMVDTAFHVPAEKLDRLAQLYKSKDVYDPEVATAEDIGSMAEISVLTKCPSSGGGLVSTLDDYLRFCRCMINKGRYDGGQLLGPKTVEWMTVSHLPKKLLPISIGPWPIDVGFGLGFGVVTSLGAVRRLASVGTYGWGGAAQTDFWIDPVEEIIGILMTQHMPAGAYPYQERFRNLAYQAIVE